MAKEALDQDHVAYLLKWESKSRQGKDYLALKKSQTELLERAGAKLVSVTDESMSEFSNGLGLDFVIIQEGFHTQSSNLDRFQTLRDKGTQIVSLAHFFEICKRPLEALNAFDRNLYVSEYARDLHFRLQGSQKGTSLAWEDLLAKTAVASSPMFDQFRSIDRDESRKKLGIDANERVVLLMAPVILPTTPWRFHVWRDGRKMGRIRDALKSGQIRFLWEIIFGSTFMDVFLALNTFCEQNDAKLIVKSRGKQKNLAFIESKADQYFDGFGDVYYPEFSSYQLMAAADLCVTVNSMAATEAAALGVACINIYVPHDDRAAKSTAAKDAYNAELMGGREDSLLNYPSAVRKIDRRAAIKYFRDHNWDDVVFATSNRAEYAETFLGITNDSSSKRILSLLEGGL